jgi:hypothetical protein
LRRRLGRRPRRRLTEKREKEGEIEIGTKVVGGDGVTFSKGSPAAAACQDHLEFLKGLDAYDEYRQALKLLDYTVGHYRICRDF